MATRVYDVKGMSCNHCKKTVTEAISRIPGVTGVEVDLGTGKVTVTFAGEPNDRKVREAVEDAGYEIACNGGGRGPGSGRVPARVKTERASGGAHGTGPSCKEAAAGQRRGHSHVEEEVIRGNTVQGIPG